MVQQELSVLNNLKDDVTEGRRILRNDFELRLWIDFYLLGLFLHNGLLKVWPYLSVRPKKCFSSLENGKCYCISNRF